MVGFLEHELGKVITTHVFTYDAWLHQADPPRRSFLESFINFLVQKKLTARERWIERVDQLNGRIQDTTITKTPQLTMAGRVILATLLGVPVGWSLVLKASVTNAVSPAIPTGWQLWSGITLVGLPLLVAAGVYLLWRPTWDIFSEEFRSKPNWTTHRGDRAKEAIFSLFLSRQTPSHKGPDNQRPGTDVYRVPEDVSGAHGRSGRASGTASLSSSTISTASRKQRQWHYGLRSGAFSWEAS